MENSCGAITHVLVNSPTEGYAVFGEIMIRKWENHKNILTVTILNDKI